MKISLKRTNSLDKVRVWHGRTMRQGEFSWKLARFVTSFGTLLLYKWQSLARSRRVAAPLDGHRLQALLLKPNVLNSYRAPAYAAFIRRSGRTVFCDVYTNHAWWLQRSDSTVLIFKNWQTHVFFLHAFTAKISETSLNNIEICWNL